MSVRFFSGQRVDYYSDSFSEWIECRVAVVRADGDLKLENVDGSVLKEAASPTKVRPHLDGWGKFHRQPSAFNSPLQAGPAKPGPAGNCGTTPKVTPRVVGRALNGAGAMALQTTPTVPPNDQAPAPQVGYVCPPVLGNDDEFLKLTLNPKPMYVGDRVVLKGTQRQGQIMYIGPAGFAPGDIVVGIRLDEKRSTSDCDGSYRGERYFWCPAGYGIYQLRGEVELLPLDPEGVEQSEFARVPAPDVQAFDLEAELEKLRGLGNFKEILRHTRNYVEVQGRRRSQGMEVRTKALHFAFVHSGSGSGTSTAARLLGSMLLKLGVLRTGQVVEVTRKDLVAGSKNVGDVEARMKAVSKAAEGGVLMFCDADCLKNRVEKSDLAGDEAMGALSKLFNTLAKVDWPQRLCIVIAGARAGLQSFLVQTDWLQGCLFASIEFEDYSALDIARILQKLVLANKFQLCKELTEERLEVLVRRRMMCGGPRNVRLAQAMLQSAVAHQTDRVWAKETLSYTGLTALVEEDFMDPQMERSFAVQAALKKMDSIVGLQPVKDFVRSLHAQLQVRQHRREMGLDGVDAGTTLHMVFVGNPGTGKTTVAKVIAELLKALGLLRSGHLVEADRSSLVAGYCGQTALKTKDVVDSALGGVLFVDEAYALVSDDGKDTFGREALDTLIKLVEDHRTDLVVVLAGYSLEMVRLLATNPGLHSRFPTVIEFQDYTVDELLEIADQMLVQDVMVLSQDASEKLRGLFRALTEGGVDSRVDGNGRAVRNILERAKRRQAVRLQGGATCASQEDLCTLLSEDFNE